MMGRRARSFAWSLCGFVAIALTSRAALGWEPASEPAPLVVYIGPAAPTPPQQAGLAALEQAARARGTAIVDLSPSPEPAPVAERELRRGIDAYHDLEYDVAAAHLRKAFDEAVASGGAGLSATDLSDLSIYRGLVFTAQGDSSRAWDDFVSAAVIDPTRVLDPARYAPRVVETFHRASVAVQNGNRSSVTIDVRPECQAWFDGRVVSVREPFTTSWGEHYLRVVCADFLPYGARVLISEAGQTLRPALRAPKRADGTDALAVARQRGAATVVVAIAVPPTLTLRLLDVPSGKERRREVVRLTASDARDAGPALERLIALVVVAPSLNFDAVRVVSEPAPWYRRPWVWGVAGFATAAAILLPFVLDSGSADTFDVEVPLP